MKPFTLTTLSLTLLLLSVAALAVAIPAPLPPPPPPPSSPPSPAPIERRQNRPTNELLNWITRLFPANVALEDGIFQVDNFNEDAYAWLAGFSTTENDLVGGGCGDVVVLFGRGTTEAGNVGALVGPPLFQALRDRLAASGRTLAVQGVDYPADAPGYFNGGDAGGSRRMANLLTQALAQCPTSSIVMSGYSQGGQLIHNAAKLLPASTMAAVSSIVIFGDPFSLFPVQGASRDKVKVICHLGDDVCIDGSIVLLQHLTYVEDVDEAADFIVAHAHK